MEHKQNKKLNEKINKSKKLKKLNKIWHPWTTIQHHLESEIL